MIYDIKHFVNKPTKLGNLLKSQPSLLRLVTCRYYKPRLTKVH